MSLRFLLLEFSTPILALMIVGGATSLTVAATYLVRRLVPEEIHASNNQVAGFLFAAVAVIYGVLVAFTTLAVWQQFQDAQVTVEREANVSVDLFRFAQGLPRPYAMELKDADMDYVRSVVNDEWATMVQGEPSPQAANALEKIWELHRHLHLASVNLQMNDEKLFATIDELGNLRRIQLLASRAELPTLMWMLLWGGALVTIGFTLFFRAHIPRAQLLMATMMSGLISFMLLLIIELDSPFTGTLHVMPLAFQNALELMQHLQ